MFMTLNQDDSMLKCYLEDVGLFS